MQTILVQIEIAAVLLVCAGALWKPMAGERGRLRGGLVFLVMWLCAIAAQRWRGAEEIAFALLALAAVQILAVLSFDIVLRRVRLPKFVSEMLIAASYASILFHLLYRLGVNVTGIFATSAVAAAVVGLALQDMLSNIASGIALEFEGGIGVGDFIRCGEFAGWVKHVRMRHTAITTPDGATVILPNSQLTRSPVHVASRAHRVFVPFPMNYAQNPQEVVDAAENALRASPIAGVLSDPPPRCVIRQMDAGSVIYAAVVWTDRPGRETEMVSSILLRLYFSLQRSGVPAGEIANLIEIKPAQERANGMLDPLDVLRRTPILRLLEDADLLALAAQLKHLSYAPGEYIIRQDEEGSSMYFIAAGEVTIALRGEGESERSISSMTAGEFFGEASLLTGERRNAGVISKTRVDCYRLDKAALQTLVKNRVELAEDMSVVIAHRQMELTAAREQLDLETQLRREAENQTQLLARIRKFFGVAANGARV